MNGFIEVYMDARGIKGAWEGVVYYVNHDKTEKIHRLADQRAVVRGSSAGRSARSASRRCRAFRRGRSKWSFETGDSGPVTPIGVNLPNDQRIREQYGSKSVSLSNVIEAYEQSTLDSFREEFCWDDGRDRARQAVGRRLPAS